MVGRLGERIERIRAELSLTLAQLAGRSRVSKSMLSKIERGEADPTINMASRIAEGL